MASYWVHAGDLDRFIQTDYSANWGNVDWLSVKDWGDVSLNFNNTTGVSAEFIDNEDTWIDTDVGGNWMKVVDSGDVTFNFDQWGNSDNSVQVYNSDNVNFYATGGGNWMRFDDVDNVNVRADWGGNSLIVSDADDVKGTLDGAGANWVDIWDVDTVDLTVWGGGNTVKVNMLQDFWEGDDFSEESVRLNFEGPDGGNHVEIRDADYTYVDTDAGNNNIYVNGADHVHLQMDQEDNAYNSLQVYNADSATMIATGGVNTVYAGNLGSWGEGDLRVDLGGGWNDVRAWRVEDDIDIDLGYGYNQIHVNTLDAWGGDPTGGDSGLAHNFVDIDITGGYWSGDNKIDIEAVDQVDIGIEGGRNQISISGLDSDILSDENASIWIGHGDNVVTVSSADDVTVNAGGLGADEGGNTLTFTDVNDLRVDAFGSDNDIVVRDAWDVTLDMDDAYGYGDQTVLVEDARDVNVTASEGGNQITISDAWDVNVEFIGWNNKLDIDDADDVTLTAAWGSSRHQDIDIDDADDVTLRVANLRDSNVWIDDADDVVVDGTWNGYSSSTGNTTVNIGQNNAAEDVTVRLGGADNTINANSFVGLAEGNDVTISSGDRSTMNLDAQGGGTADINITAGQDSDIDLNVFSAFDTQVDMTVASGDTDVAASGANVNVRIQGASNDRVESYGAYASIYTYAGNDDVQVFSLGADVDTGEGDDSVTVGAVGASIRLGAGNDEAWVGAVGVHIDAGDGDDVLNLTATGANVLAGAGDDKIHALAAGANIQAGSGDDEVWIGAIGTNVVTDGGDDTVHIGAAGANINTGDGNDTIYGVVAGSWIDTGAGDDDIYLTSLATGVYAGAGNDHIYSVAAGQFIYAGDGNNDIVAVGGANAILAGDGDDVVMAVGGANVTITDDGDDLLIAGGVGNLSFTGAGNDDVMAVGHSNLTVTEDGNDNVFVVGGILSSTIGSNAPTEALGFYFSKFSAAQLLGSNVTLTGEGDDFITAINVGSSGGLILSPAKTWKEAQQTTTTLEFSKLDDAFRDISIPVGKAFPLIDLVADWKIGTTDATVPSINLTLADMGDDTLVTVGELNVAAGGFGDDTMISVGKNNIIFGGDPLETAFVNIGSLTFSVDGGMGTDGGDFTIKNGAGEDVTVSDDDTIITAGKSSKVYGMQGDDAIIAVGLKNSLAGGYGDDLIVGIGMKNGITGGTGDDILVGFGAMNVLMGGAGDDIVISAGAFSIIGTDFDGGLGGLVIHTALSLVIDGAEAVYGLFDGGSETDQLAAVFDTSQSAGDDIVVSTGIASLIFTGHGDDTVFAGGLGSFVYGGSGNDMLVSGAGGNVLIGGAGNDTLLNLGGDTITAGGRGADTFIEFGYGLFLEYADTLIAALETFDGAVSDFFAQFGATVGGTVDGIGDRIAEMFSGIDDKLSSAPDEDGFLTEAGLAVQGGLGDAASYIRGAFSDLIDEFGDAIFDTMMPDIGDADITEMSVGGALMLYPFSGVTASGGSGDDVFVTGFGVDSVSGGEGSDTYVFYQNEGVEFIEDTGETGTDTVMFKINNFDPPLDLGDIYFTGDGLAGAFAITTGPEGSANNIIIKNMHDDGNWAVEEFTIDFGDTMINFDLTSIYSHVQSQGGNMSLADVLDAESDRTFEDLASALADAVSASDDGSADAALLDTGFIIGMESEEIGEIFNISQNQA